MEKVLVHYGELALKGKNRSMFEKMLMGNIRKSADIQCVKLKKVKRQRGIILCEFDDDKGMIISCLK